MSAGAAPSAAPSVVIPISSPHDPHVYRTVTLSNALQCMLINDKPKSQAQREREAAEQRKMQKKAVTSGDGADDDAEEGAESKPAVVALSVRVGSFSDPQAIPGLAHFLEHMLFMGNAKYPSENEWEEYLSEHGGASNAYTEAELTVYYFEINPRFLHEALQRFAQFFISPLFAPSATKREIRAVDSEFRDCLNSDPERVSELINYTASLVNPEHPFGKWGWGSLESLETNLKPKAPAATAAAQKGKQQQQSAAGKGKGKQQSAAKANGTSTGAATLASAAPTVDLRTELKAFHARWYSAHAMKLVVYNAGGKMDKMESCVRTYFSEIDNNGLPLQDFSHCGSPFIPPLATTAAAAAVAPTAATPAKPAAAKAKGPKGAAAAASAVSAASLSSAPASASAQSTCLQQKFFIVPIKEQYKVSLSWVLTPSLQRHYRHKPAHYAEHLLGHEGKGSLYSLLRDRGWITALVAGVSESGNCRNTAMELLQLTLSLTKEGSKHVDAAIDLVFQFLALIRHPANLQPRIWTELQALADIGFRFCEAQDPCDMVQDLAANMHLYPPEHTILGDFLHESWSEQLTQQVLQALSVQNVRVDVISPEFKSLPHLQRAPWFGTQWLREAIPAETLARWSRYDTQPSLIDPQLHLPLPNPFVPTDFSIHTHVSEAHRELARRNAGPQRIGDTTPSARAECWWHLDETFALPRAHVHLLLETPVVYASAHSVALTELLLKVWVDYLSEFTYAASLAELEFSVESLRSGVEFKFAGFDSKLPAFAAKVLSALGGELEHFLQTDPSAQRRFESLREKTTRHFSHLYFVPMKQANHARLSLLQQRKYSVEDITSASRELTVEQLLQHIRSIRAHTRLIGLVDGNVPRADAEQMFAEIEKSVRSSADGAAPANGSRTVLPELALQLPVGHCVWVEQRARNSAESNHALEAYWAMGPATIASRAVLNMLETLLAEPAFDQLRTKEQLGYQLQSGIRNTHGILGFIIAIQSNAFDPAHLARRVHAFLFLTFYPFLLAMPPAKFDTSKESLIAEFLYADSALAERVDRQWEEISEQKSYVFSRPSVNAQQLRSVTHEQVVRFFEHYFLGIVDSPPTLVAVADAMDTNATGAGASDVVSEPSASPEASPRDAAASPTPAVAALQLSPSEAEAKMKQERKDAKKQRKAAQQAASKQQQAAAASDSSGSTCPRDPALEALVARKSAEARQLPVLHRRHLVVAIWGHSKAKQYKRAQAQGGDGGDGDASMDGSNDEEEGSEDGDEDDEEEEEESGAESDGDSASGDDSAEDPSVPPHADSLWFDGAEWGALLEAQAAKDASDAASSSAQPPKKKQKNARNKQTPSGDGQAAQAAAAAPAAQPAVAASSVLPRVAVQFEDGVSVACACSGGAAAAATSASPAGAPSASGAASSHPAAAQGEHVLRVRTFAALTRIKQASSFYPHSNGSEPDLPPGAIAAH